MEHRVILILFMKANSYYDRWSYNRRHISSESVFLHIILRIYLSFFFFHFHMHTLKLEYLTSPGLILFNTEKSCQSFECCQLLGRKNEEKAYYVLCHHTALCRTRLKWPTRNVEIAKVYSTYKHFYFLPIEGLRVFEYGIRGFPQAAGRFYFSQHSLALKFQQALLIFCLSGHFVLLVPGSSCR